MNDDKLSEVLSERENAYGDPREMCKKIAGYWSNYLRTDIDHVDVAIMMGLFKISRGSYGNNEKTADDLLDARGYLYMAENMQRSEPTAEEVNALPTEEERVQRCKTGTVKDGNITCECGTRDGLMEHYINEEFPDQAPTFPEQDPTLKITPTVSNEEVRAFMTGRMTQEQIDEFFEKGTK